MDRFWLSSYPPGVPAEVDASRYPTLTHLFEESFARYGGELAYTCLGSSLTYGDIDRMSLALAGYLQTLGLKPGARVAIMLPNVLQYPVALIAVLRAGFVAVNVNPLYTARELQHQLADADCEAIIILENFAATLQQAMGATRIRHVILASIGELLGFAKGAAVDFAVRHIKKKVPAYHLPGAARFKTALREGNRASFRKPEIKPDDIAVLQYTGGTTGVSKGAMLLHKTIVAAVLACEEWLKPALVKKPRGGQLTFACVLPLYHIFGLVTCALLGMRTGGHNILVPDPRDMNATLSALKKRKIHIFPGVNTLYNRLLANPRFKELDFSELAVTVGGGMAVQSAVAKHWFETTGCPILEGYGLSETTAAVICNRADSDLYTGAIGLPMPGVDVRILDDEGREAPLGETGEIAIRGPQVMTGYWRQPAETALAMTADGFFKSGDIGSMDRSGLIKVVDRKKDMILVSGFNVYPNEIEDVVAGLRGVAECAAVGVPDPNTGEAVALFVVAKDGSLTKEDIAHYCKTQLTGYKQPKHIELRKELPKTNVGKILRRELRKEAASKAPLPG